MLEISLEGTTRLDSLGRRLRVATDKKTRQLTEALYQKVIENLSGRILNKQSGQLISSIHQSYESGGDEYHGRVFVSPQTPKAWALEKGGRSYYPIVPVKAQALHFFTKGGDEVFTKHVAHPPAQAFGYLRRAAEELRPLVPEGYREYLQMALYGSEL